MTTFQTKDGQLYNEQTGQTIAHMINGSDQDNRLITVAPQMYELLKQVRQHSDKLPEQLVIEIATVLFTIDKNEKQQTWDIQ